MLGAAVTKKAQSASASLQNFWAPDKTASANGISTLSATMVIHRRFLQYLFVSSQVICSAHLSIRNSTQCVFLNHSEYVRFSSKAPKGGAITTRPTWKHSAAVYGVVPAQCARLEGRLCNSACPGQGSKVFSPPIEKSQTSRSRRLRLRRSEKCNGRASLASLPIHFT